MVPTTEVLTTGRSRFSASQALSSSRDIKMKLRREGGQREWRSGDHKTPEVILHLSPSEKKKKSFLEKAVNFFYTNLVKMTLAHSQIRTIKMKTSNAQIQTSPCGWEMHSQDSGPFQEPLLGQASWKRPLSARSSLFQPQGENTRMNLAVLKRKRCSSEKLLWSLPSQRRPPQTPPPP